MSIASNPSPVAIVLAAGMGLRLRAVVAARPKGFVEMGGEPIIAHSVRALRAAGVSEFVFVVGWQGATYRAWTAAECPGATCVENAAYASTGSLASLLLGAALVPDRPVLIVESDLLYEPGAPRALLAAPEGDTVLVSGFTGSGDEVWVYPDDRGQLLALSKEPRSGRRPLGELVGLTRATAPTLAAIRAAAAGLPATAHYEDGFNAVAATRPISLLHRSDLVWCEIDDPTHLARAHALVWPRIAAHAAIAPPAALPA